MDLVDQVIYPGFKWAEALLFIMLLWYSKKKKRLIDDTHHVYMSKRKMEKDRQQ